MRHFRFLSFKAKFKNNVWQFVTQHLLAGCSLAQGRTHQAELEAGETSGGPHGRSSPAALKQYDIPLSAPPIEPWFLSPQCASSPFYPWGPLRVRSTLTCLGTLIAAPPGATYKLKLSAPQPALLHLSAVCLFGFTGENCPPNSSDPHPMFSLLLPRMWTQKGT